LRRRFLSGLFRGAGLAGRPQGVDDIAAVSAQLLTVRCRYLVDQPVRTQQTQLATDRCPTASLVVVVARRLRVQEVTQVAVAKAVNGELAAVGQESPGAAETNPIETMQNAQDVRAEAL
jgi:hypothetical protein